MAGFIENYSLKALKFAFYKKKMNKTELYTYCIDFSNNEHFHKFILPVERAGIS